MNDILTTFCDELALTSLSTVSTDSFAIAPLAQASAANPAPTRSLGNAYHNESNPAAFFPTSNGLVPLLVEFVCTAAPGASMADIALQLICADDSGLTSSVQVLQSSGPILRAKLAFAATQHVPIYVAIPPLNTALLNSTPNFIGVRFVATGSGGNYGTWTASLVTGAKKLKPSTFEDGVGFL